MRRWVGLLGVLAPADREPPMGVRGRRVRDLADFWWRDFEGCEAFEGQGEGRRERLLGGAAAWSGGQERGIQDSGREVSKSSVH